MLETVNKRNFIKRMLSLCLLPFIPVSSLLNKKENVWAGVTVRCMDTGPVNFPFLQSFYHWPKEDLPLTRKKWYYINDRFSGNFKILNGYRTGENINGY